MPKPTHKMPEEVKRLLETDYSYLERLDAEGWLNELTRLYKLSIDNDLRWADALPGMLLYCGLGKPGEVTETTIGQIGLSSVRLIPRTLKTAGAYVSEPFVVPGRRLALTINLDAPDAIILTEVELVLKAAREHVSPPVLARGRNTLSSSFDNRTAFKTWRNHMIVQLADLLALNAARKARGETSYPEKVLGMWLEPIEVATKRAGLAEPKNVYKAKSVLKAALARLPSLVTQVAQEKGNNEKAQKLTADWIARNMVQ